MEAPLENDVVSADRLTWHDAGVYAVHHDEATGRMTWAVEVFRWDLLPPGVFDPERDGQDDAQPGDVVFEGVDNIEADTPILEVLAGHEVNWEVLEAHFERTDGQLRCSFGLIDCNRRTKQKQAYETIKVICRNALFTARSP